MSEKKFEWNPEYSVGIKLLDYDHQELFATVDELRSAIEEGTERKVFNPILNRLSKYAMEHFQREEHIMSEYGFPETAEHRHRHQEFTKLVYSVRRLHINKPEKVSYNRLLKFLEHWLVHHILGEDMKYKSYLRGGYGKRATDITEPLADGNEHKTFPESGEQRKKAELATVSVLVPAASKTTIRRCARLLQLGGEKAALLEELADPIGSITDDEAERIAMVVLDDKVD